MPTNALDRRRRTWQREVIGAVEFAMGQSPDGSHLKGVDRVLGKMEKWLDDPAQGDARLDWDLWVNGRKTTPRVDGLQGLSPLAALLDHDTLPVAFKRRALTITRRLEACCPEWLDEHEDRRYYGTLPLSTWLRCADLPEAVTFLNERLSMPRAAAWALPGPLAWGQAFARLLENPVTHTPRRNDHRALSNARRVALFQAAIANGWVPSTLLDTHDWSEQTRVRNPGDGLIPAELNGQHAGRLPELLAAVETPGGLFDHWRQEREDWSTWISPSTETTVWRSLLINHNPALLVSALRADPSALDRPVPVGRWVRGIQGASARTMQQINGVTRPVANLPGIAPDSVRAYAGISLGTHQLELAIKAVPEAAPRLLAWWDDQAPLLRDTIEVLAHHILPAAATSHFGKNPAWANQVGSVAEGLVLRDVLDNAPSAVAVRPRSRL